MQLLILPMTAEVATGELCSDLVPIFVMVVVNHACDLTTGLIFHIGLQSLVNITCTSITCRQL